MSTKHLEIKSQNKLKFCFLYFYLLRLDSKTNFHSKFPKNDCSHAEISHDA